MLCVCAGAIFASLEVLASRSVTLKQYKEQAVLPDWCNLFQAEDKEDKTLLALKTDKPVGASSLDVTSRAGPAGETAVGEKTADTMSPATVGGQPPADTPVKAPATKPVTS